MASWIAQAEEELGVPAATDGRCSNLGSQFNGSPFSSVVECPVLPVRRLRIHLPAFGLRAERATRQFAPQTRHERRRPLLDFPATSRRQAYGWGRVMSRELISWIAAVAVGALFVAIVLWLRTFALAPG
jgi:hypothetical protein